MQALIDNFLIPVVTIIGTALAPVAATYLTLWITKLAAKAKVELSATQEAVLRVKVHNAIIHTKKTYVDKLREAKAADGKLTPAEATEALGRTIRQVTRDLGPKGLATLANVTGKGEAAIKEVIHEELGGLDLLPKS